MKTRKDTIDIALLSLAIGYVLFFVNSIEILNGNKIDAFGFRLDYFFRTSFLFFLTASGFTFSVFVVAQNIHAKAKLVGLGLLLCFWLQGSLALWDYGKLNGNLIDFTQMKLRYAPEISFSAKWAGSIELGFWVLICSLILWKADFFFKNFRKVVLALILILTADVGYKSYQNRNLYLNLKSGAENLGGVTRYSSQTNVLLIILDSFQSDYLEDVMKRAQWDASKMDGFIFYRNAVSAFGTTLSSIANLLSTSNYAGGTNGEWHTNEIVKNSIIQSLAKEDRAVVNILSTVPVAQGCYSKERAFTCNAFIDFLSDVLRYTAGFRTFSFQIMDIALFRSTPHMLKKYIFTGDAGIFTRLDKSLLSRYSILAAMDIKVLETLKDNIFVDGEKPEFKVMHFFAPHGPYSFDDNCVEQSRPFSFSDLLALPLDMRKDIALGSSTCIIKHLRNYFEALKEKGIYDNTMIFVVGDHGNRAAVELDSTKLQNETQFKEDSPELSKGSEVKGGKKLVWFGTGIPLFLFKPMGKRGPLETSDKPVALCDIPPTLADFFKSEARFQCQSLFIPESREPRVRKHFQEYDAERKVEIFNIQGHSWLRSSWSYDSTKPYDK
ncbi:MAG: sulfatase-like hydrolase/transferase [Pseudobdellovibrionaceae bacterium]